MKPYSNEERELMEAVENEDWVSVDNIEEEIRTAWQKKGSAKNYIDKMNRAAFFYCCP